MIFTHDKINYFRTFLDNSKTVMIIGHRAPDGDAIGSSCAMAHFLKSLGKEVQVWMPDSFPDFLLWIPGADDIKIYEGNGKEGNRVMKESDLIFCMDFNRTDRTGPMSQVLGQVDTPRIVIDHHLEPANEFAVTFSETKVSSTCELVYQLIESLDLKHRVDLDTANCIYTGLVTDTGSFKYNVHPSTHRIAGELIGLGVNSAELQGNLFDTNTRDRLGLLGYAISEKLRHFPDHHASFMTLSKEELERFNYKKGDTEGLVNYGLSIEGVRFTALASEKDGVVKISFRSKGDTDVNVIANKNFGGGGHKNAAGARSEESLERVEEIIEEIIKGLPA
ncbi:MAG: bifunctional oligoribonuclease/PAP phosphatase NrnA [Flavobacteriales bacterium]|nr:bifunctional oligoribonuclease/PAP phosphatase NrnA [Flavobacteriales bacterium]NNK81275.1 bifunctional oligoribonuclease/PAP phosphatase NrnA [Flavobacteriales bacterium]